MTTPAFEDSLLSFSHDLYQETDGSVSACVSPFSIISALLMLMAGTRGTSKSQIKTAIVKKQISDNDIYLKFQRLNIDLINTSGKELKVATKLFVKKGLTVTSNVQKVARTHFNADIGEQDFTKAVQSANEMNSYVASKTTYKITDLIKTEWLNVNTVMVLVNAIYFKGTWETQFDPKDTKRENFFTAGGKTIQLDMMSMKHHVRYYKTKSFSAIALPYSGNHFEAVIVKPTTKTGLTRLKNTFTSTVANAIHEKLVNTTLLVKIPKVTFEVETNLAVLLPEVGITDIFDPVKADFSNLVQNFQRGMYVSQARQKMVVEVNEIGTEAAAGTAIVVTRKSALPEFVANHPLLFYIRHVKSRSILFIGHFNP